MHYGKTKEEVEQILIDKANYEKDLAEATKISRRRSTRQACRKACRMDS